MREEHGWSQDYLAEASGIGRTHISQLENGRREAGLRILETLAGVFNLSASELLKNVCQMLERLFVCDCPFQLCKEHCTDISSFVSGSNVNVHAVSGCVH